MVKIGTLTLPTGEDVESVNRKMMVERIVPGRDIPRRKQTGSFGEEYVIRGVITENLVSTEASIKALADGVARTLDLEDGSDKIGGLVLDPAFRRRTNKILYELRFVQTKGIKTVLLLHMNGASGSQVFEDSSFYNRTVTAVGNAQLAADYYKFGGAAGKFDGVDDRLEIDDSDEFWFGTGDFNVDFPLLWPAWDEGVVLGQYDSDSHYWLLEFMEAGGEKKLHFLVKDNGNNLIEKYEAMSPVPSLETWYHFEVSRASGQLRFFQAGLQLGSPLSAAVSIPNYASKLTIMGLGSSVLLAARPDEVRIIKGKALHTGNFTPPVAEHDPDAY